MKQSYNTALRHYSRTENTIELSKGLREYEDFLDAFLRYKFFYELDVSRLGIDYRLLNHNEVVQLEQIKQSESLKSLFYDFKYKKCDDIYLEINLNQRIWEKSYNIVDERDKLNSNYIDSNRESYFDSMKNRLKHCVRCNTIPQSYLYLLVCFMFIVCLFVLFPKVVSYFAI